MPTRKKPLETLVKQGGYRPSRHGDRLPPATDPGDFDPDPPEWLGDFAKREWERVVPLLLARNILRPEDASLVAVYCATFGILRTTLEAGGAPKAADLSAFNHLAAKLGLSPADRAKTLPAEMAGKPKPKPDGDDAWSRMAAIRAANPGMSAAEAFHTYCDLERGSQTEETLTWPGDEKGGAE